MRRQNSNKVLVEKVENKVTGAFILVGFALVLSQVVRIFLGL